MKRTPKMMLFASILFTIPALQANEPVVAAPVAPVQVTVPATVAPSAPQPMQVLMVQQPAAPEVAKGSNVGFYLKAAKWAGIALLGYRVYDAYMARNFTAEAKRLNALINDADADAEAKTAAREQRLALRTKILEYRQNRIGYQLRQTWEGVKDFLGEGFANVVSGFGSVLAFGKDVLTGSYETNLDNVERTLPRPPAPRAPAPRVPAGGVRLPVLVRT